MGEVAGDESDGTAPAGSQATARSLHLNSITYPLPEIHATTNLISSLRSLLKGVYSFARYD